MKDAPDPLLFAHRPGKRVGFHCGPGSTRSRETHPEPRFYLAILRKVE